MTPLPRAAWPFVEFATLLRANGFAVSPDQTESFIAAVGLLGPRSVADIHKAGLATLAPAPERREEFDALFRLLFFGQSMAAAAPSPDDEVQAFDEREGDGEPPEADRTEESGGEAARNEVLALRAFSASDETETLRRFRRAAPWLLPRRTTHRRTPRSSGDRWDMRRTLRDAVRRDGEVVRLPRTARKHRQRRILLLIDVSGSMKTQTESHMRFAHALARASEGIEVFTLGTRLTRVTRALRHRHVEQALATASGLVADWDGGTRLGDALQAFLGVPRFAGFARGALVVVVSDGLERGSPDALVDAVRRLSRRAWRTLWLTPLAGDPDYRPQTAALVAALPFLDRLGSAASTQSLCAEILDTARLAA